MNDPLRANWKFATFLTVLAVVACGGMWGLRHWQLARSEQQLVNRAQELQSAGRHEEALPLLERCIALFPRNIEAQAAYARSLDQVLGGPRATPKARARVYMTYAEAVREGASDPALRRRMVEIALEISRPSDALKDLARLRAERQNHETNPSRDTAPASSDPETDAWIAFHEGRCREMTAEYAVAAEAYQRALDLDPSRLEAGERLARVLATRLDDPERAARVLDALVAAHADAPQPLLARAQFYRDRRDWPAAAADLEVAARLDPDNVRLALVRADVALARVAAEREKSNDEATRPLLDAARDDLSHAAERAPHDVPLWLKATDVAEAAGDADAAIQALQAGLEKNPGDLRLQARLADLQLTAGRTEEARKLIESINAEGAAGPLRDYLEARLRMADGDWRHARDTLETALRNAAGTPEVADHIALRLAECCRQLGNTAQEVASYRRVLRNNPRSEPARLGIAAAHVRNGKPDDAILEYGQLAHRPEVRPILARLLIERNARLPEDARDWKQVDALLDRIQDDPDSSGELAALERAAAALRESDSRASPLAAAPGPSRLETSLQELSAELDRGHFDAAARIWNKARRVAAPGIADLHSAYAAALIRRGRLDDARHPLDALRRVEPDSYRTAALAATWHMERGESQEAHRLLDALASAPTSDPAVRDAAAATLASLLADRLEKRAAADADAYRRKAADELARMQRLGVDFFRRAIQEHPERLLPLAGFLASLGDAHPLDFSPDAWNAFHNELAADPLLIVVHCGRMRPALIERVQAAAEEGVRRDLRDTGLRLGLGDLEGLLGRFDASEKWYRSVLEIDAEHHLAMNNLAWVLALRRKSSDEALALINRAIDRWGAEPRLLDTRGVVHLARGEPKKALRDLEASLRAKPGPVTALHLAEARFQANDRNGAVEALRVIRNEGVTADRFHPLERALFERLRRELLGS